MELFTVAVLILGGRNFCFVCSLAKFVLSFLCRYLRSSCIYLTHIS